MRQGAVLRAGVHAESHPEGHLSAAYKNFHSAIDIGIGAHAIGFKEAELPWQWLQNISQNRNKSRSWLMDKKF